MTYLVRRGGTRGRRSAARRARRCRPARTTSCARRGCCARSSGTAARVPRGPRRLRRRGGHRRAVLRHGARRTARSSRPRCRPRSTRRRAPAHRRAARRRARRDPRRRLAGRGLEGFGKPTGYLERQVRRFAGLWEHSRTREVEAVERVGRVAGENMPESGPATIVHGDFRLGNAMFAAEAPAAPVRGLRLGDGDDRRPARRRRLPLRDVERGRRPAGRPFELGRVTRAEGFPTRAELDRPLRGALGRARSATWPGTRRSRSGSPSCSWRATTAAPSRAAPTTRT